MSEVPSHEESDKGRPVPHVIAPTRVQLVEESTMTEAPDVVRRRDREERRRRRREEAEAELRQQLENNARWLYILGFFALPLLWLVSVLYFHREHRDENASPIIKNYYVKSRIMLVIYTVIFVTWFIVFQVKSEDLFALDILRVRGASPSGI